MFHAEITEEYSEKFNLSKADTVADLLRAYSNTNFYHAEGNGRRKPIIWEDVF